MAWSYTGCPKKIEPPFFFPFSRCPVCGEWCKLHWLLLDTPSFDRNTRRSRGHKIFKMAPTKQQNFFKKVNLFRTLCTMVYGYRGSTVVKVLCYKSEGRWFDPSWCQWNFSLTKSFWSHYGPGVNSASNRNEYQEYFLGVKAAGA